MKTFNYALLLKWHWWWFKPGHKLWKPLLENTANIREWIPAKQIFLAIPGDKRLFFNVSTQWIPGDGSSISLWDHNWGAGLMKHKLPNLYSFTMDSNIILSQALHDRRMLHLFRPNLSIEARQELSILQAELVQINLQLDVRDDIIWRWTAIGEFTVKLAYIELTGRPRIRKHI